MKRLAILTILAGAAWADQAPRPYQVESYVVRLTPDLAAKKVAGEAVIRFTSRIDRLDAVELDAGGLRIESVMEGQERRYFERKGEGLIVVLPTPGRKGEPRSLTIAYTAPPAKGLVFFPDQVYTSFFTSDWMPCDERPDNRATLRLTVNVPHTYRVAGSGRAEGGSWVIDTPAPAFLYAFAAGEFAETNVKAGDVTLRILGRADVAPATAAATQFLIERSGHPYPGGVYTQVFTHGTVEQEAVGMTLLPESYVEDLKKKPDDLWLLAHELAHQWYAVGIATQDWSDFWLSEGMATFLADAFLEKQYGKARYDQEIARSLSIYQSLRAQGRDRPLHFTGWATSGQAGGSLPYHKGAWVLAELRKLMGDDAFWRGLRTYTASRWGTPVTSENFQAAMQSVTRKDLSKFFEQWVY